jgi:hypothetical protein
VRYWIEFYLYKSLRQAPRWLQLRRATLATDLDARTDLKLQIAGYAFGVDEVLVRGDPACSEFAVFHLKGAKAQSVEAINGPPRR